VVDQNEFFRNATLRICGALDIVVGLGALFDYLSRFMPADRLLLQRLERDPDAMRIVGRAGPGGYERLDIRLTLPDGVLEEIDKFDSSWHAGDLPTAVRFNRPRESPLSTAMAAALGEPMSSAMVLPLVVEGEFAGSLVLLAQGEDRFSEADAELFADMKDPVFVAFSNALKHEETVRLKERLADDNRFLRRELFHLTGDQIVGADFGLRSVIDQVRQVAPTESPVLITGETGTGKDLLANAIHMSSPRREGPFVPVNCGAIPDSLLDSELFGHERGAFTGAPSRKQGRFERASGGTIFLDEIGEMPLDAQVRLLRVLQHREIERLGGTERIPVDIRIVAATNQDLSARVNAGSFRKDLWYRLNVFPIMVPPLRDRVIDIPALVEHFVERKTEELKLGEVPSLDPGAMDILKGYSWPGNVRELENVIERAMIVHGGHPLRFDDLKAREGDPEPGMGRGAAKPTLDLALVMKSHIERVLAMAGGKIHGPGGAAELLGMNPSTLRYRIGKLGIRVERQTTE
jgi:transcriptional regulator with GAF, ATPase, and Fis domain